MAELVEANCFVYIYVLFNQHSVRGEDKVKKVSFFIYGLVNYIFFNLVLLYFIAFIGNFLVPKTIDSGTTSAQAVLIDVALIVLFGLQHSIMARPAFKRIWSTIVPPPIERSTYILFSCLALVLLCGLWQPIPTSLWQVDNTFAYFTLQGLFWFGWLFSLYATFLVDHFDLMGLRQVRLFLQETPYTPVPFKEHSLYRFIRHPIMLGTMIGLWATPSMSVGHFLLSSGLTLYILIGVRLEEKDLNQFHGENYQQYCQRTSMIMPNFGKLINFLYKS